MADWRREAARMRDVYSNSFLNLSATGAPSSSFPLFSQRDHTDALPQKTGIEIAGVASECYLLDGEMWNDDVTDTAINQRAWVFQERILARRVLHFGKQQLVWECCEIDAAERFPNGMPIVSYSPLSKQECAAVFSKTRLSSSSDGIDALRFWQRIVEIYSRCDLTKSEDKLVALSGVAQQMRSATGDQYLAGLWKQSMALQLPWWRESIDRRRKPRSLVPYRAPSWSWASVDGQIIFPGLTGADLKELIHVVENDLHPVYEQDATGALQWGSIKIECMLNKLFFENLEPDDSFDGLRIGKVRFAVPRGGSHSFLSPETEGEELRIWNEKNELYCVACCVATGELCGIILTPSGEVITYSRIGSFSVGTPEGLQNESQNEDLGPEEIELARMLDISDLYALVDALKSSSGEGNRLPCDSYNESSGLYEITLL
ncbi:MAG: hypothetical protein Q9160_003524 [Pyrenula sp. 1 TL-2023]